MRKLLTILAFAIPVLAAPIVTYTTSGTFSPPGGSDTTTIDGGTLTYMSASGSVDLGEVSPSTATLGSFTTAGITTLTQLVGYTFTLTINETSPGTGSGSVTGTLSGKIGANASDAFVKFANPVVHIGDETYTILQSEAGGRVFGVPIVPSSAGPTVTVQGLITSAGLPNDLVPEPKTMAMVGLALAAVSLIGRRRRNA
jgi:hypothetical protein